MRKISFILINLSIIGCSFIGTTTLIPQSEEQIIINEETTTYNEAGTYPIEYSYTNPSTGETITTTVYMTVLYPKTVTTIDGEAIDAKDVIIAEEEVTQLSNQELIELAGAHAWSLKDGSPIAIPYVTCSYVGETNKTKQFSVTFATENGAKVTTTFLEMPQAILDTSTQETYLYLYSQDDFLTNFQFSLLVLPILLVLLPIIILLIQLYFFRKKQKEIDALIIKE